jgi:hypothetical protein
MIYLPSEIINYIFLFVQSPTNKLMNHIIEDCYEEDYDPFDAQFYHSEYYHDKYCFEYSFKEWYFLYRKNHIYKNKKDAKYKHTPKLIPVGNDKLYSK